eukprot:9087088-Alexandrium_andersonii.AAC.1
MAVRPKPSASCAPLLDGLSLDMLRLDGVSPGCGSVTTDAGSPRAGTKAGKRVAWADAHDGAQCTCLLYTSPSPRD